MKPVLVTAALLGLCAGSCMTFYRESPEGRPTFATTGDNAGFTQTRPDGTTTTVWGGENSTGQKHAWDFAGTYTVTQGAVDMLSNNNATDLGKDKVAAGVASEEIQAGSAAEAGRQATERARISADTAEALAQ